MSQPVKIETQNGQKNGESVKKSNGATATVKMDQLSVPQRTRHISGGVEEQVLNINKVSYVVL